MARRERQQAPPPEFFIDRSLGSHQLPSALRAAGLIVHTLASVYGEHEAQRVRDEVWLELAGRNGWIVLAKDDRIRRRPLERAAIIEHRVKAFVLTSAGLRGDQQVERILTHRHRIIQRARRDGPYVYGIYADGLRRLRLET